MTEEKKSAGFDNTLIERFVQLVRETKEIKLEDCARALGVDEDTVVKMAEILGGHEIIKVNYTIVGETVYVPGANIQKKPDEIKEPVKTGENESCQNKEDKTERVEDIVEEIRRRILEKRYSQVKPPEK